MATPNNPHTKNPIFDYELRQAKLSSRWVSSHLITLRIFTFSTLALMIGIYLANQANNSYFPMSDLHFYVDIAGVLSGLFSIIAEVYYMSTSVDSINRQMRNGSWDLLKLTTMDERDILLAKYAVSQRRARRMLLATRLVQLVAFVQQTSPVILLPLLGKAITFNGIPYPDYLPGYLPIWLLHLFVNTYWLPYWSMNIMITIGLTVSARINHATSAMFIGSVTALITHILLLWGSIVISSLMSFILQKSLGNINLLFQIFMKGVLESIGVYGLYWLTKDVYLQLARYYAFRPQ